MAVLRDLRTVCARIRGVDVAHDRERLDAADDLADGDTESSVIRSQRVALNEHRLAGPRRELRVDQSGRTARLAGNRVVLLQLDRAGCLTDQDGDDHESEPAEDRDLPMARTPATHASRQIVRVLDR